MTPGLTPKQRTMLAYLQAAENPPTMRELAVYMGMNPTSQNAISEMLIALERKGYIRRPEHTNRARCPVTILRPLPGVLSPRNKLAAIRATLEKLTRVRADLLTRGAPVGGDAAQLLGVADRDALEAIGAVVQEQPDQAQAGGGAP